MIGNLANIIMSEYKSYLACASAVLPISSDLCTRKFLDLPIETCFTSHNSV